MTHLLKNQFHILSGSNKNFGAQGEQAVSLWLCKHGYTVLIHNYRTRSGEVDIIAQRGTTLSFIEVKTRRNMYFSLSQVITPSKQLRITRAAHKFLYEQHLSPQSFIIRFDVALVSIDHDHTVSIDFIENAFTCASSDSF